MALLRRLLALSCDRHMRNATAGLALAYAVVVLLAARRRCCAVARSLGGYRRWARQSARRCAVTARGARRSRLHGSHCSSARGSSVCETVGGAGNAMPVAAWQSHYGLGAAMAGAAWQSHCGLGAASPPRLYRMRPHSRARDAPPDRSDRTDFKPSWSGRSNTS